MAVRLSSNIVLSVLTTLATLNLTAAMLAMTTTVTTTLATTTLSTITLATATLAIAIQNARSDIFRN